MFENKNENEKNPETETASFNAALDKQKIASELEKYPTHTMKNDLEEASSVDKSNIHVEKDFSEKKQPVSANPFASTIKIDSETPTKFQLPEDAAPAEKKNNTSKVAISIIAVLIIFILIGGGYYFWLTRIKDNSVTDQNVPSAPISNIPETSPTPAPVAPTFSEKQANYLSVDIQNTDTMGLKNTLKKYATEVSQMASSGPIEFIVTDTANNPVLFSLFSKKIGLNFSPLISSQLAESFSLFIYLDNSQPHFGLTITSKNSTLLKNDLTIGEKGLITSFLPLLPENTTADNAAVFNSSSYNGDSIRYANIASAPNFSIDYTVSKNKLIIGTSKMTTRSVLDYLSRQTVSAPVAK